MRTLAPAELPAILDVVPPERPGPLVVEHIVASGVGRIRVDRWPAPRAIVAELSGDNVTVRGDPSAVPPEVLTGLVEAGSTARAGRCRRAGRARSRRRLDLWDV